MRKVCKRRVKFVYQISEEARKALKDAQEEARRLNSSFVGREHLVLAMLNEDTRAYSIIDSLGADAII